MLHYVAVCCQADTVVGAIDVSAAICHTATVDMMQVNVKEKTMANEIKVTAKLARSFDALEEHSKLSGIPLEEMVYECLSEYIKEFCPAKS
jgi:hypothetical protein